MASLCIRSSRVCRSSAQQERNAGLIFICLILTSKLARFNNPRSRRKRPPQPPVLEPPVPINFATTSDDGSVLYVDGNAVVDNNNLQAATQATGMANLTPGLHTIDVEYYQGGGGATLDVQWETTGGTNFVDIPNSAFSTSQADNGLNMTGTGTLTVSNTNSYSGTTIISAGTLQVGASNAIPSTSDVTDDGTLDLDGRASPSAS